MEMGVEVVLPTGSAEAAMPLQILLICIYRCLRVLAAYWVFKSLLRMSIVVGGACARAKRHTNMIVRAARFAPNKP